MSSSNPDRGGAAKTKSMYRLDARGADPDVSVDVVDGWDRVVAGPAFGGVSSTLPRGPYVVRFRLGGALRESPILLSRDMTVDAPPMERASSAPIEGTSTSHEYYSGPAESISRRTTGPASGPDATGRVFVFVRAPDRERAAHRAVGRGLRLADAAGQVVASFDDRRACERHDEWGWGAASLAVRPGPYRLCFDGPPARLVPLQVLAGWQTQAFVLDAPGSAAGPRPETLRVFIRRDGFDPRDQFVRDVDTGYEALANLGDASGPATVPPSVVKWLLSEKCDDPMLGLLGAWLRLLSESRVPMTTIDNLESLVGPAPDVVALRIAAALRGGPAPPQGWKGPDDPPMFRMGLQALIDASAEHPEAVSEGSSVDMLSAQYLSDLAWTSWTPAVASSFALSVAADESDDPGDAAGAVLEDADLLADFADLEEAAGADDADAAGFAALDDEGSSRTPRHPGRGGGLAGIGRKSLLGKSGTSGGGARPARVRGGTPSPRRITWVERALLDAGVTGGSASSANVADLARRLSLPPSAVLRAIRSLGKPDAAE